MPNVSNSICGILFAFFVLSIATLLNARQEDSPAAPLDLWVVDMTNERPLPNATVEVNNDGKSLTLQTDSNGQVSVPGPESVGGYFGIFVGLDGYVKKLLVLREPERKSLPKSYTLKLEEAIEIRGKVTDDTGAPIAGATVVVNIASPEKPEGSGMDRNYISFEAVKSDNEGNWKFNGAPMEFDSVGLGVWSYRHVSGEFFQFQNFKSTDAKAGAITLSLSRGISIEGVVMDKNDKPLQGAQVMFGSQMASNKMDPQSTNEKGEFLYTAQEGEMVTLTITAPGHSPEIASFKMADETHELTVYLEESEPMFGRIIGPDDEPVPFAWVFPDTWRGSRALETRVQADKDGKFLWKDAPYDEVKCDIDGTAQGYLREQRSLVASEKEIVIRLKKALRVSGTVVDETTGKPIDQFHVIRGSMRDTKNVQWERERHQKPMSGGKFSYTVGWPSPRNAVRIEAPGYLPQERLGFKQEDGDVSFDFLLTPAENLKLTIMDSNGIPIAKAKAYLALEGQNVSIYNGSVDRDSSIELISDSEGILDLPPQNKKFSIVVYCEAGYAKVESADIEKSNKVKLLGWGKLSGTLLLDDKPAANQKINVSLGAKLQVPGAQRIHQFIELTTDQAGKFSFDRIPEGEIMVSRGIDKPAGKEAFITEHSLTKTIEIVAGKTATITLKGRSSK